MGAKKMSQKLFDYRLRSRTTKSPLFYIISFIAIFFFVYAEKLFSSSSILQTIHLTAQQSADELSLPQPVELTDSSNVDNADAFQLSRQENDEETETDQQSADELRLLQSDEPSEPSILEDASQINNDASQLSAKENGEETETVQQSADELRLPQSDLPSEPTIVDSGDASQLSAKENGEDDKEKEAEEEEEEEEDEEEDPLIPPENVSKEERMTWFRRQLPELKILKSSGLSLQFHSRVMSFINTGCLLLFHIIWLSPARSFGNRDFLTMDTLFQVHPQACLLILSRTMDSKRGDTILKPLIDRGFKVFAVTPDLPFLVKDTPAEAWLQEMNIGTKDPGHIPLSQNLANLIRLAFLYKYGGVYLDTDIIVLRDMSGLRNVIGAQSVDSVTRKWNRLNGAIMIFDINHPILLEFLQEFASTFDGNKWGHNGPYLVSRVIERLGSIPANNLRILPPKAFYPVNWYKIGRLFRKPENESESRWVESKISELYAGETYAIHLWNKRSRELEIEEGSVMARIISQHCVVCAGITRS
ncbi:uncharacterized protein At4g19900-like [Prosopis cineraria]|uniref:uncharacterized protein At4g19900-like n=1 Tax=Prosopis cineraria TaxID=364024 RepID=UPI00240F5CFB|nr:uncharacterized protein At4g19900-like [Prosopis cineraria]